MSMKNGGTNVLVNDCFSFRFLFFGTYRMPSSSLYLLLRMKVEILNPYEK